MKMSIGRLFVLIAVVTSFIIVQATWAGADGMQGDNPYVPGQLIVKFKGGSSPDQAFLSQHDLKSSRKMIKDPIRKNIATEKMEARGLYRLYLVELSNESNLTGVMEQLNLDPRVEYAEPNYIVTTCASPDDPDLSLLWGLDNNGQTGGTPDADIDAIGAWDIETGSNDIVIAVIDTGVDYNHEDLAANMWLNPGEDINNDGIVDESDFNNIDDDGNGFIDDVRGWDFFSNDNDPYDTYGHGTHCAGTIGAVGNNGTGVVGVNWNVTIMPIRFLGPSGTTEGAILSVAYATSMVDDDGVVVDIMSNSWGGGGYSEALEDAISAANDANILFVAAAGNYNSNTDIYPHYPSSYDIANVVSVAATDHNDQRAYFSNYGLTSVDLGAPGVNIYSTVPTDLCTLCDPTGYKYLSGTSMATPHVSGVAGLIKAALPDLTPAQIKARILARVDLIDSLQGITVTGGRLNANNSLGDHPIAYAGADQRVTDADGDGAEMMTLDGSMSSDFNGWIVSYDWEENGILLGSGQSLEASFAVGVHVVTLTVTDDEGETGSDQVVITVDPNEAPVAEAGEDKVALVGDVLTFNGSGFDSDGYVVKYEWNFGDGNTATGQSVSHTYSTVGNFDVTLTVTDNGGATGQDVCVARIPEAFDVLTVKRAIYYTQVNSIEVFVKSSMGGEAVLTAEVVPGLVKTLYYDAEDDLYKLIMYYSINPETIPIKSSYGGTVVAILKVRGGGKP